MIKVAAYLRVSTEEQAEQNISLPLQQSRLLAYCESRQWDLFDFYIDDGYSGKDLSRPNMSRLISDAKASKFDMVLVVKLDRLSRRQQHVMYLIEDILIPKNIGFASVTENFDTTTPMGRAMLGIMAAFAQLERETIVERVTDAKKEAAKQGRFMGGISPYGYSHDAATKSLKVDPLQADIVRFIFDEYLKGQVGYQGIADILQTRKVPPHTAKQWHRTTIRAILSSPFYIGMIPHKGVLHPGKHEPIIDPEKWDEVQRLKQSRGGSRPVAQNCGLLQGIVYCGECGARMRYKLVNQTSGTASRYYACYSQEGSPRYMVKDINCKPGYKIIDDIDAKVVEQLTRISVDEDYYEQITRDVFKEVDTSELESALLKAKKEHGGIKGRIDRWASAFESKGIDIDEYLERTKELKNRRYYLESEMQSLEERIMAQSSKSTSKIELLESLKNFKHIWDITSEEEHKSILAGLVKRVNVFADGHVGIEFED
ncbi:DNA-invertase hin [Sporomusa ovata DSM 2662]|uniref:Putative phage integrase n=1 Tax=Sporomusa ovata TaxID=2378 RepID=A0A0U1L109_9FIRM|nr:recombinase family protein [Sporomusa ovata]EQB27510.1 site-specific recombinase, DNA invertase Pin-like protein [Sporomusa ovata DSM 2662]CQR73356.1 putative phage integrase [Sporomusa ovata]